ncbi:hypothetical protein SLEP1_g31986 [Rubroshorea leprosula]|uniref:Uncharacterized protein n=1 Tax=Rubroshorea leprosula TaxID=152421 RepID=A0AAV5KBW7_9ROSI|nr:hypothetical protein SLEP1_g31986 [Rubroshorea leprosula]
MPQRKENSSCAQKRGLRIDCQVVGTSSGVDCTADKRHLKLFLLVLILIQGTEGRCGLPVTCGAGFHYQSNVDERDGMDMYGRIFIL